MLEDQPFDVWSQVRLLLAKKLASSKRHLQCHEMGMNTKPAGAGLFLVLILVTLKDLGATAAGLEALLAERQKGREPNSEASQALVEQIRRELAKVSRLILA